MYSTHNEGRSAIAERFIRTLKNKIYKDMTSISKNVYIDKLRYIDKMCILIKMKPGDVNQAHMITLVKK